MNVVRGTGPTLHHCQQISRTKMAVLGQSLPGAQGKA